MSKVQDGLSHKKAIELASEIERTEAALKEMKKQLREFVEKNGDLETSDKIWKLTTSESWKFDPEGLKEMSELMALEGYNPFEFFQLPKRNLDKLGWDESVLAQFGQKRETKRFVSRKK